MFTTAHTSEEAVVTGSQTILEYPLITYSEFEWTDKRKVDADNYPEGGSRAWLVIGGAWCLLFVSSGWINCIGVFQAQYESDQLKEYTSSAIAWIPSFETWVFFANGAVIGKLYDNLGPFWVMLFGTFLHIFGVMMISLSTEYYQLILTQGLCSPLGASCLFYAALNASSTWFKERRALALGIVVSGASVGGVVLPIMMQRLIPTIGFAWSIRSAGFLMLALCLFAQVLVKSRIPPKPKAFSVIDFVCPLQEYNFLMVTLGSFFFFWGMFLPFNFIIVQARTQGMSAELSSYLLAILNGASLFGRILPGYVGDKLGRFNIIIALSFLSGLISLGLWVPATSSASLIVYAALYGFSSGAFISLAPALVAQISQIEQIGMRQGTFFAFISWAALTGNPIGGAIRGAQSGDFIGVKLWTGINLLVGTAFLLLARVGVGGWGITKV